MARIHVVTNAQTGETVEVPFTPEEELQADAEAQAALEFARASQTVSMRQARIALLQSGLLADVESAIAAGNEADKITWEYATEVVRGSPMVQSLSTALGLTKQQLDDLFALAKTL